MSGSGFPEGLCTLLVNHHAISQPSTASWRLAFSSQRLSGPCYSHCRVACMLRSNGSWGTCIPQGITTFLHYASRRNAAPQSGAGYIRLTCISLLDITGTNAYRPLLSTSLNFGRLADISGKVCQGRVSPKDFTTLHLVHHAISQPSAAS